MAAVAAGLNAPDANLFLSGGVASAQQHGAPLLDNDVQEVFQCLSD